MKFREKLLKYALEVDFRFGYVRNDTNRVHTSALIQLRMVVIGM